LSEIAALEAEARPDPGEPDVDVCRNCLVVIQVTDPLPLICRNCGIPDPLDARLGSARRGPTAVASTENVSPGAEEGSTPPVVVGEPTF
jgi:hypothetical protein